MTIPRIYCMITCSGYNMVEDFDKGLENVKCYIVESPKASGITSVAEFKTWLASLVEKDEDNVCGTDYICGEDNVCGADYICGISKIARINPYWLGSGYTLGQIMESELGKDFSDTDFVVVMGPDAFTCIQDVTAWLASKFIDSKDYGIQIPYDIIYRYQNFIVGDDAEKLCLFSDNCSSDFKKIVRNMFFYGSSGNSGSGSVSGSDLVCD